MSYDLVFWKQSPNLELTPQEVYERLCEGEYVEGIIDLPRDEIIERLYELYPSMEDTALDWSGPTGAFQAEVTGQSVIFLCYSLQKVEINKLIDMMMEFDCPLFDPQVSTRFITTR